MSQVLGPGWRRSPAHLFLLGSFLEPQRVEELSTSVNWDLALGGEPGEVVEEFLAVGVLGFADRGQPLADRLAKFRTKELREMVRERDLPVSGRKDNLISRLIEADPEGMEEAARELSAVQCTEEGRTLIEEYLVAGGEAALEAAPEDVEQPAQGLKERTIPLFERLAQRVARDAARADPQKGVEKAEAGVFVPSESDVESAQEHLRRGRAHGRQGDYDRALAEFDKAIELNPQAALPYLGRGLAFEHTGDYQQALVEFHRAVDLAPEQAECYVARGDIYRKLGDPRMAIAEYNMAVRRDPELAAAYHNRGVAYESLGDYERALAEYDRAVDLGPELAEPYFGRGVAYERSGDYERAEAEFERVLQLSDEAEILGRARGRLRRVRASL